MSDGKNIIKESSFLLAKRIIKLYKHLTENKKEFIMSKQLWRSGTGVGALVREAQNAESKADFIHKLGIAQKNATKHYIGWSFYMPQISWQKMNMLVFKKILQIYLK